MVCCSLENIDMAKDFTSAATLLNGLDAPVAFEDGVSRAVRLLDEMRGAPVPYRLKIGSQRR